MSRHTKKHPFQTVLALDSSFMPMVEMSRRKALKAMASGRAHALDLQTWSKLGWADVEARPFHAVVFPKAKAVSEVKLGTGRSSRSVFQRDGYRCQYCQAKANTLDHVVPRCQGGLSTWSNLVACCLPCNQHKGGRTPEQAGMKLLRPVQGPRYQLLQRLRHLTEGKVL
jgi:hypothetical protein